MGHEMHELWNMRHATLKQLNKGPIAQSHKSKVTSHQKRFIILKLFKNYKIKNLKYPQKNSSTK